MDFVILAASLFFLVPPASGQNSGQFPFPRAGENPGRDRFSGRTVQDKEMAWALMEYRIANAPRVGEMAPPISLLSLEGGKEVRLEELTGEGPVVLFMTSWSCDIFRESLAGISFLHRTYGSGARFVMVYIREAHPFKGFGSTLGRVDDPTTIEERRAAAERCKAQLRLPFPIILDAIEDPVATRWGAWPIRVFVIDGNRKVVFAGAQGPWGYRPYRGFLHGNGKRDEWDLLYSQETLEEFLEKRFPKQ